MRLDPKKSEISLRYLGKQSQISVFLNLSVPQLIEQAIINKEGNLSPSGSLMVKTGKFTGRSPHDKYIVDNGDIFSSEIDWGNVNQPFSVTDFNNLFEKVITYLNSTNLYVQDVYAGSHPSHKKSFRLITQFAWSALFARNLLQPAEKEFSEKEIDFTVIQVPLLQAIPEIDGTTSPTFIILNFDKKVILIGHTEYAGEIKKAIFTVMNRILPEENVLPMHCSANISMEGESALFFGLSGTGKTTLSSDQDRFLIGDDEHGWAEDGIFNIENGCYAKTINLNQDLEPIIWQSCQQFGSILENVVFNPESHLIDFSDDSITENSRGAYPIQNVSKRSRKNLSPHPNHIFFLSADAFGVLPPISSLSIEQAVYFFLSGYTAKLAGTELDLNREPSATFSACFGAPFMPLHPTRYALMLKDKIEKFGSKVWLVNTGWSGGPFGIGSRIKLPYTRAMISAALKGILDEAPSLIEPYFNLRIPTIIWGVPTKLLNPINSWESTTDYEKYAKLLISKFQNNFQQYKILSDQKYIDIL